MQIHHIFGLSEDLQMNSKSKPTTLAGGHRKELMTKRLIILLIACFSMWGLGGVLTDTYTRPIYEGLPTNGLVLHYKMDEASWNGTAGEVKDSASTNNGTSFGGVITNPGKFDRSAYFSTTASRIQSIYSISTIIATSVSLWVKPMGLINASTFITIGPQSSTAGFHWFFWGSTGTLRWQYSTGASYQTVATVNNVFPSNDNKWYHISVVHDYTVDTVTFYINGVFCYSSSVQPALPPTSKNVYVANYVSSVFPFKGELDDVRIYNRVLSSNEISQIYLAESYDKRRPQPIILQGAPFSPLDINGCALWLDGSDTNTMFSLPVGGVPSANNGLVFRWEDKSGNGNHATNTTVGNQYAPSRLDNAIGGKTCIYFNNEDFLLSRLTTSTGTVFVVMNGLSDLSYNVIGAGNNTPFFMLANANSFSACYGSGVGTPRYFVDSVLQRNSIALPANGFIFRDDMYRTFNNRARIMTVDSLNLAPYYNSPPLYIFRNGSGAITGYMGDILIYNRVLSTAERQQVEKYLSAKWAIPLNGVTTADSTLDSIQKAQTPVSAVYQGTNRVYRFKNRNYPKTVQ